MQTRPIPPVSPVIATPREPMPMPRPKRPAPAYWAETAPHPFIDTVRASQPAFGRRSPEPNAGQPNAAQPCVEEAGWVMGDAVEQSVSRWLIIIGGSIAAAATGALLGSLLSMSSAGL